MGYNPKDNEVTIEDVKAALKVIRLWLKQQDEVERTLRAVAARMSSSYVNPQYQLMRELLMAGMKKPAHEEEEEYETELSPEERERLRKIAETIK